MEDLRALVGGCRCLVVGSAPLARPLVIGTDEVVVAVNGGISSVREARIGVWLVNARRRPYACWTAERITLNALMVQQGAGRHVGAIAWVLTDDEEGASAVMAERLRVQGTTYDQAVVITRTDRARIEVKAGARTPAMRKHALSAGLFAVAVCLWAGAERVRAVGVSWRAGYAYLPGVELPPATRGHVEGDRLALAALEARHGRRLEVQFTGSEE